MGSETSTMSKDTLDYPNLTLLHVPNQGRQLSFKSFKSYAGGAWRGVRVGVGGGYGSPCIYYSTNFHL